MKQREALNDLTLDILSLSKKKNRRLIVILMISVAFNIILSLSVIDMKMTPVQCADETILMGVVMGKKPSHI